MKLFYRKWPQSSVPARGTGLQHRVQVLSPLNAQISHLVYCSTRASLFLKLDVVIFKLSSSGCLPPDSLRVSWLVDVCPVVLAVRGHTETLTRVWLFHVSEHLLIPSAGHGRALSSYYKRFIKSVFDLRWHVKHAGSLSFWNTHTLTTHALYLIFTLSL